MRPCFILTIISNTIIVVFLVALLIVVPSYKIFIYIFCRKMYTVYGKERVGGYSAPVTPPPRVISINTHLGLYASGPDFEEHVTEAQSFVFCLC